jgi:uncharacterized protein YegP (UPF0339 family)
MYYEYWKSSSNGYWYWHLRAANHKVIATGEGYHNEQDVLQVIALVKGSANAPIRKLS